jgi:hypothetical protein
MGASFIGRAAVFGVTASLGATMSPANCIGSLMIQSFSIKPDAVVHRFKAGSSTVGQGTADPSLIINFKGIYTGTGLTDAATQASRMPKKGDIISIADATDSQVVGNYVIDDAEKTTDVNEPKMLSITAVRFLDNDITAAVAA